MPGLSVRTKIVRTRNPSSENPEGWPYAAWEEGYASETSVNPYLPENEVLAEFWRDGFEAKHHDNGVALGRIKRESERQHKYWLDRYWP